MTNHSHTKLFSLVALGFVCQLSNVQAQEVGKVISSTPSSNKSPFHAKSAPQSKSLCRAKNQGRAPLWVLSLVAQLATA
jgi:hypothetical protein